MTGAIVGVRKASQIEQTAEAGEWELSGDEIATIDAALAARDAKLAALGDASEGWV